MKILKSRTAGSQATHREIKRAREGGNREGRSESDCETMLDTWGTMTADIAHVALCNGKDEVIYKALDEET